LFVPLYFNSLCLYTVNIFISLCLCTITYHHWCEYEPRSGRCVQHYVIKIIKKITLIYQYKKMYKKKTFYFSSLLGGFLSGGFCPGGFCPVPGINICLDQRRVIMIHLSSPIKCWKGPVTRRIYLQKIMNEKLSHTYKVLWLNIIFLTLSSLCLFFISFLLVLHTLKYKKTHVLN
jgi:hypothetical protein